MLTEKEFLNKQIEQINCFISIVGNCDCHKEMAKIYLAIFQKRLKEINKLSCFKHLKGGIKNQDGNKN